MIARWKNKEGQDMEADIPEELIQEFLGNVLKDTPIVLENTGKMKLMTLADFVQKMKTSGAKLSGLFSEAHRAFNSSCGGV